MEPDTAVPHLNSEVCLRLLHEALEAMAQGPDPKAMAEMAVHMLAGRLGYPIAAVVVRDPPSLRYTLQALHPRALLAWTFPPEAQAALHNLEEGIYPEARPGHQALLRGEPWVTDSLADLVPEALAEAWEQAAREVLGREGRYVALPVGVGDEVLAIAVVGVPRREVPPEEVDLLRVLCCPLAMGLERLRLSHRVEVLQRTFTAISRRLDLQELLEVAVRQAAEVLHVPAASLTLWDRETDTLRIAASHGLSEDYVRRQVIPAEEARRAAEAAGWQPFVVPDRVWAGWGGEDLAAREGLRTVLVVPLQVGEERPGSLNIYSREVRTFAQEEVALATALGEQVALALHNARLYERARRRLEEMTALRDLAVQMAEPQPLETLLQRIVEEAARLMDMDAGSLYLLEEETGALVLAAAHNVRTYGPRSRPMVVGEGLCGRVVATGEPLAVADYAVWPGRAPQWADEGVRADMAVPLKWGGRILGVLDVFSHEHARTFSKSEIRLLELFAQQAAVAVENARLREEAERRLAEMTALRDLAVRLSEPQPLDDLLQRIVEEAIRLAEVDAGGLYILREGTQTLELVAAHNLRKHRLGTRMQVGEGICGRVVATGEPLVVADYATWSGRSPQWIDEEIHANAAVPLKWGGRILGVLGVFSHERARTFSKSEIRLLELFAQQAAVAVENARLREEAERRLAEMAALRDLAVQMAEPQPLEVLLQRIVEEATHLAGTDAGVLYRYDEEAQELELVVSHNVGKHPPGLRMKVGEGLAGKVVETGGPVSVADYGTWEGRSPQWEEPRIYASVAVPLKRHGRILGTLGLTALEPRQPFGEDAVRLLELFAQQAAVAVENARLMETLRQEKAFTEGLLETAPVLVVLLDPEGRILLFNRACEDLTGYRKEEVLGKDWFSLFIPERQRGDLDRVFAGVKTGQAFHHYENPIRTRDGRERLIAWRNVVLRDEAGKVQHVLSIGQDVTEEREAEREILRRSTELSLLVEAGQEFARELDWERVLHRVAHQARDLLEADSCTVFLLEEDGETLRPAMAVGPEAEAVMRFRLKLGEGITGQVAQKGVPELVNQAHLDPRAVHVPGTQQEPESLLCAPLVARGKAIGILVLSRLGGREFSPEDLRFAVGLANLAAPAILNARLYREARQEARRRADLLQSMAEALVVLDPSWRIVDVNEAMCQMTGFSREELVGQEPPFPHWPPDRVDEYMALARELQARPRRVSPLERTFRRKDGRTVEASASLSPVYNEAGELEGFLSVMQDVTERKALEEQLRQAQKMEAIGTLAGGIAHDFNNILVGILGYASLLQAELPRESPLQGDVEVIIRSARRAADLTQQLLSFARRSRPQEALVDLNALVEEVVALLRQTVDRRIEIVVDLEADLPPVKGDATQLQQVALNLGINACEAMPEGGRLTFSTALVEVSEAEVGQDPALEPGPHILLEVVDTGVGMDERTLQRIFEPFFTTKEHGRGLGLATTYGIVRAHGGSIRVESAVGRGTAFRVLLPAAGVRVERGVLPVLDTRPLGGTETILVVDDEEDVRALVARVLQAEGYRVYQAEDGQRAIEVLAQCKDEVDLVVLDLVMPRMDGVETFRRLREVKPDVRVLVSSGYSPDQEGRDLLEEGAAGFLQKPYDMDQVLRKVREVLDRA